MVSYHLYLFVLVGSCQGATLNPPCTNSLTCFTKWPTNNIHYKYMGSSASDLGVLRAAAEQISSDTGGCVNFTLLRRDQPANQPHLVIQTRFSRSNVTSDFCFSYPGYTAAQRNKGQVALMFSQDTGPNKVGACLDDVRDAMRILMNAIGIRNEFLRSDRDSFMAFPSSVDRNNLVAPELQHLNIFADSRKYNTSVAINAFPIFDKDSVTMISGTRFAANTSDPVFSTRNNATIGQLARLSVFDCRTVRYLYSCLSWYGGAPDQTDCADPYSTTTVSKTTTGGLSFDAPDPVVLTRTLQCPLAHSTTAIANDTRIHIGQFLVNGLLWGPSAPQPTLTITPPIRGLAVQAVAVRTPITLVAGSNAGSSPGVGAPSPCPTTGPCGWAAKLTLTSPQTKGFLNRLVTVVIQPTPLSANATLTFTLTINCAPQFQAITSNVGYSASMTSTVTKKTAENSGIVFVSEDKLDAPQAVYETDSIGLTPYTVNYVLMSAFGEDGAQTTGLAGATVATPKKVFVNCNVAAAQYVASPPLLQMGGVTAVATVQAIDPEGGPLSYFAFSGTPQHVALENGDGVTAAPELHTVTREGVVLISTIARTAGVRDPFTFNSTDNSAGNAAGAFDAMAGGAARDIYIVAVDAQGAYSVLQARFYFACGLGV